MNAQRVFQLIRRAMLALLGLDAGVVIGVAAWRRGSLAVV
jgi:hypothetical protein